MGDKEFGRDAEPDDYRGLSGARRLTFEYDAHQQVVNMTYDPEGKPILS